MRWFIFDYLLISMTDYSEDFKTDQKAFESEDRIIISFHVNLLTSRFLKRIGPILLLILSSISLIHSWFSNKPSKKNMAVSKTCSSILIPT